MIQTFDLTGCRKHPRLNLWAREGCSYFISANGHQLSHSYNPAMRAQSKDRGYHAPVMRWYRPGLCHVLMGEIFYGERPTFFDSKGNPYFGICHHLIEEPLNYCPENLLCWLTYSEHCKADNRRRALESLFPNLHALPYNYLRQWQDPRETSDEAFQTELARITEYVRFLESVFTEVYHWQTFTPEDYMRFFSMPLDDFKSSLTRGLGPLVGPEQMMKESFYDKE